MYLHNRVQAIIFILLILVHTSCSRILANMYSHNKVQAIIWRYCSGLKGRRPFWVLNPPPPRLTGVPSLLLLGFFFSGDEEMVE